MWPLVIGGSVKHLSVTDSLGNVLASMSLLPPGPNSRAAEKGDELAPSHRHPDAKDSAW
jgi:hypothetical protein